MKSVLTKLFVRSKLGLIMLSFAGNLSAQMPDTGQRQLILGPSFKISYQDKKWQQFTSNKFFNRELPLFESLVVPNLMMVAQTDIHLEDAASKALDYKKAKSAHEFAERNCNDVKEMMKANKSAKVTFTEAQKGHGFCHVSSAVSGTSPLYQEQYFYVVPSTNRAKKDRFFTYTLTFSYPQKIDGKETDQQEMKREIASFIEKVEEQNFR